MLYIFLILKCLNDFISKWTQSLDTFSSVCNCFNGCIFVFPAPHKPPLSSERGKRPQTYSLCHPCCQHELVCSECVPASQPFIPLLLHIDTWFTLSYCLSVSCSLTHHELKILVRSQSWPVSDLGHWHGLLHIVCGNTPPPQYHHLSH